MWTNRGLQVRDAAFFRGASLPTTFYVALVTDAVAPTVDTNTLGELTQIPVGNGYVSGGVAVPRNNTGTPSLVEDDALDLVTATLQDVAWTATGGNLPASGTGARYAVLTDDNATVNSRQVLMAWDLGSNRIVSTGQTMTLSQLRSESLPT